MSKITLQNMEFHAYHGCLSHEKELGNTFILNLTIKIDTKAAAQSDNLLDALNYQEVYDVVKEQMEIPSNLIEHVAQRIVDTVLKNFKQVYGVKLQLSKLNPPLGAKVGAVTIKINKKRP